MNILWKNPFTNQEEAVNIPDQLRSKAGRWRIPLSFRTTSVRLMVNQNNKDFKKEFKTGLEALELSALHGLIDMANKGDLNCREKFMLIILNVLEVPETFVDRKLQKGILSRTKRKIKQYVANNSAPVTIMKIWQEVEALIIGKQSSNAPLIINIDVLSNLCTDVINVYRETFPEEGKVEEKHLRNFRERLHRKHIWETLPDNAFSNLRHSACFAHCFYFDEIARAYFDVVKEYYSQSEQKLFSLLHFSLKCPPAYSGLLEEMPPISSLDIFHPIRTSYIAAFGIDPCSEYLNILEDFDDEKNNLFLNRVLAVLHWYRTYYLLEAREGDQKKDIGIDNHLLEQFHAKANEDLYVDAKKPLHVTWVNKFKELPFKNPKDLFQAINQDPSSKRRNIMLALLQARTPQEIAEELKISRQAVMQMIATAFKKLKKKIQ